MARVFRSVARALPALAAAACLGCGPARTGDALGAVGDAGARAPGSKEDGVQESSRPNLIVVMVDDVDELTLAAAEERGWMPHLAALRARGTSFSRSFTSLSLCCPSRATFLTGLYPHNTKVFDNKAPDGGVDGFDDSSTIATWLEAAGYRTGYIGKYLNGYGRERTSHPASQPTYVPPGWSDWQGLVDPSTYRMYDFTINDDGVLVEHGGPAGEAGGSDTNYQTDVLADRAVRFIEEGRGRVTPFLLLVNPMAAHLEGTDDDVDNGAPRPAPRHEWVLRSDVALPDLPNLGEELDDIASKPDVVRAQRPLGAGGRARMDEQLRHRVGSLLAVDDLVGRVVEAARAAGVLDDTVLVFTSDNGWLYGQHRLFQKRYPYEESIRIPLVIADYRRAAAARSSDALVVNTDLAPTLAELAGVTPALAVDGRSLVPLLGAGGEAPRGWRRRFLVRGPAPSRVQFVGVRTSSGDAVADSLYVRYEDRCRTICTELYRLADDPYQLRNRALVPSAALAELTAWTDALDGCGGGSCQRLESCARLDAARTCKAQ